MNGVPRIKRTVEKTLSSMKSLLDLKALKMLKNPLQSVGGKLFVIFVVSIIAFVFIVGMLSYVVSKNAIERKVSETSYQTMIQGAEKLDMQLSQYMKMSMQIMFDPNLTKYVKSLNDLQANTYDMVQTLDSIQKTLQGYTLGNELMENIYLVPLTEKKQTLAAQGYNIDTQMFYEQKWFDEVKNSNGQPVWLGTMPNGINKSTTPTIGLARQMKDVSTGTAEYVIIMELKLATIANPIKDIEIGEGSSVQVINTKGEYMYAADKAKLTTAAAKWLVPEREKESGSRSGSALVSTDSGERALTVFHEMQSTKWVLVGAVPVKELVKDASIILLVTFISMAVAAIIAIVIGLLVMRMISKPLMTIQRLMNEGAQGNLAVRAEVKTQDEIGKLSAAFNVMMEQITGLVKQTEESARSVLETAASLSDASRSTAISAREIAVATEEIAKGATSLAVEAERGHDLTHNMAEQMTSVVEANTRMDQSAQDVEQSSSSGASNMNALMERTKSTEDMMRSLAGKVNQLSDSTKSIRQILDVLNNMTKQTNILSLNATIEAARAGAAGKGFMVVADEIRNLADQSHRSIDVVGQITEKIQQEIIETVEALSSAFPIFQMQTDSVRETDVIFNQVQQQMGGMIGNLQHVTGSIERLSQAQATLVEAMSNVSAVAEEASATSEEVASLSGEQLNISTRLVELSQQLEEVSTQLKDSLSHFKYE
ncbi:methyl-accepting chemotaxis protein [Paenibacillus taiwanensis]|uniref:methyl-accepting chemotaxis protein n=1 Tax=Paenibacillus taiwanensis TaxID=401638 RepID=UPI000419C2A6|nr:methyl-accepting chemotaxis protein [Paenibacillus taiwanensis]